MDKVLVFTNYDSGYQGLPNIRVKDDWYDSYPDENNSIVICATNQENEATLQAASNLSEEGAYLIYDKIGRSVLEKMLNECKQTKDRLCVLIHSRGRFTSINDFNTWENIYTLRGIHEQGRKHLYEPVFDIIADSRNNKLARIVNSIFMPEAVLGFLNECLVPKKKKTLCNTNSYHFLCKGGFEDALVSFVKKYESCHKLEEYRGDLEKLRDTLIKGSEK